VFSDLHGDGKAVQRLLSIQADYYIAAGDLVTWARGLDRMGELLQPKADQVWVLPGNHESADQTRGLCAKFGFHDLHQRIIEIAGHHVAGLGYSSPTPFDTPGEYSEEELAKHLGAFAGLDPLVLVCHAPPFGTKLDRVREGLHAGSRSVAAFLDAHQPRYFFCGHIHEAEGVEAQIGRTTAVNVGKRGYLLEL
jgi:hypothetical protein